MATGSDSAGDSAGALSIVSASREYAVVNKPAGLLSVPGRGEGKEDCVASRVRAMFPAATGPIIVHRLDMETSGLMVVALNARAHRVLSGQFMRRAVEKRYAAALDGVPARDEGVIDLPLRVDWPNRPRQVVDHDRGRPSRTRFEVIGRVNGSARVAFFPETGRSHQIRVHSATPAANGGLGAAIAGDPLYGDASSAPRMLLHADRLAFIEPEGGSRVEFSCVAPF